MDQGCTVLCILLVDVFCMSHESSNIMCILGDECVSLLIYALFKHWKIFRNFYSKVFVNSDHITLNTNTPNRVRKTTLQQTSSPDISTVSNTLCNQTSWTTQSSSDHLPTGTTRIFFGRPYTSIKFNNKITTTPKHIANCFTKQFTNTVKYATHKTNRSINRATHKIQGSHSPQLRSKRQ